MVDAPDPTAVGLLIQPLYRRPGDSVSHRFVCIAIAIRVVKRLAIDILPTSWEVIPNGQRESFVASVWHRFNPRPLPRLVWTSRNEVAVLATCIERASQSIVSG
jgi:hypothetical protein